MREPVGSADIFGSVLRISEHGWRGTLHGDRVRELSNDPANT